MESNHELKSRKAQTHPADGQADDASAPPLVYDKKRAKAAKNWVTYILDRVWSILFLASAVFGCKEAQLLESVLYAEDANRVFVDGGVVLATLSMMLASYIEVYRHMLQGENVQYESAKTSTHALLLSMLASGIFFTIGMWPVWQWMTLPYLFMWFWGILVQVVMIFPSTILRLLVPAGYLAFMFAYMSRRLPA